MHVSQGDPAAGKTEYDAPIYSVFLWAEGPAGQWSSEVHDVTDADVLQVLEYARAADCTAFELFIQLPDDPSSRIRILGDDPLPKDGRPF